MQVLSSSSNFIVLFRCFKPILKNAQSLIITASEAIKLPLVVPDDADFTYFGRAF